jgi:drug/metabolite transporter (DMT)-like permease
MIYSSFGLPWGAQNLDGSTSITWRSGVALLLLIAVAQWISFWTFRRRIALKLFLGMVLCVGIATLILYSSYSFSWEPKDPEGTFPLTWRSDVVILLLLSVTQGLSFLAFRLTRLRGRKRIT